jgi:ferric-dicitrate binding protein FerR (iron transport regulator)
LLNLADNSQILIKANSRVVLKSPAEGRGDYLELLIGRILAKIQKRLDNAPAFRMGTPTAVITVRGTRFLVEVNKKLKTSVEVYEGVVEVAGFVQSAQPVLLRPGFYTGVNQDRAPEQPRQTLGEDDRSPIVRRGDDRSGSNRVPGGEDSRPSGQSGSQSGGNERDHD